MKRWLTESYEKLMEQGLQQGLTRKDISVMRTRLRPFSSPIHENTLLLKIRLRLELLRVAHWFVDFPALRILEGFEVCSARRWNPALIQLPEFHASDLKMHFYVIPSPYGFRWDSPRGLFLSLKNYLQRKWNHRIGHAMVILKAGDRTIAAAGMTGETNLQVMSSLVLGGGLEFLFRRFCGRLENHAFIEDDISNHKILGHIEALSFFLTKEQFFKCLEHLEQWNEKGLYQNYGLAFHNDFEEGASCTSFAIGFLKIAGVLNEEHEKNWTRTLHISEKYFASVDRPMGFLRFLYYMATSQRWAEPGEKIHELKFWDPDLICAWIRSKQERPLSTLSEVFFTDRLAGSAIGQLDQVNG